MTQKFTLIILFLLSLKTFGQNQYLPAINFAEEGKVQIRLSYNKARNATFFSAYNEAEYPLFVHIHFKEVSKLSFFEKQPYIKKIPHGFTNLFVLEKSHERNLPRFPFEFKVYPSNPLAVVDLNFPYLLPFCEGEKAILQEVDTSNQVLSVLPNKEDGFYYGFRAFPGQEICACRKGVVVDIFSNIEVNPENNSMEGYSYITLLHEDGTLATYFNATSKNEPLKLNQTIYPGNVFSHLNSISNQVIVAVYYNRLFSNDFIFISPKFQLPETDANLLEINKKYTVTHPKEIRLLEMNKKEKKKLAAKDY